MEFFAHRRNLPIRLKASLSLFVSSSVVPAALKLEAPKLLKRRARNKFKTYEEMAKISEQTDLLLMQQ